MRTLPVLLLVTGCAGGPAPAPAAPVEVVTPPPAGTATAEQQAAPPTAAPAEPLVELAGGCQGVAAELRALVASGIPDGGTARCGEDGAAAIVAWHSGPQRRDDLSTWPGDHGAALLGENQEPGRAMRAWSVAEALWFERPCMMCRTPSWTFELAAPWHLNDRDLGFFQETLGLSKEPLLRTVGDWKSALRATR